VIRRVFITLLGGAAARPDGSRGATLPVVAGSGFGAWFDAGRWLGVRRWPGAAWCRRSVAPSRAPGGHAQTRPEGSLAPAGDAEHPRRWHAERRRLGPRW
jgi:hypothetical protein